VQSDRQFETASAHMANIVPNSPHNTTTQKKKKYQTKQLITLDQYKSELLQTKANVSDALLNLRFHPLLLYPPTPFPTIAVSLATKTMEVLV
jgi:hypothetical protein